MVDLVLERLDKNHYDLPVKQTAGAASLDFHACLDRELYEVDERGQRHWFICVSGFRHYDKMHADRLSLLRNGPSKVTLKPGETVMLPLGFKTKFSSDYVLILSLRSSASLRGLRLANGVGIIDSDYRGELMAIIHNDGTEPQTIENGERIVQGLLTHALKLNVIEGKVDETARGVGGFGSTN